MNTRDSGPTKIALAGIDLYEKGDFLVDPFHGVTLNEEEKAIYDDIGQTSWRS